MMAYASEADRARISNGIRAVGMDLDSIAYFEPRLSAAICAAIGELRGIADMIASGHAFSGPPTEIDGEPVTPIVLGFAESGFRRIQFQDACNDNCTIEDSMTNGIPHVWLGLPSGPSPLNRAHVAALLPHLHTFVEAGKLGPRKEAADE